MGGEEKPGGGDHALGDESFFKKKLVKSVYELSMRDQESESSMCVSGYDNLKRMPG